MCDCMIVHLSEQSYSSIVQQFEYVNHHLAYFTACVYLGVIGVVVSRYTSYVKGRDSISSIWDKVLNINFI